MTTIPTLPWSWRPRVSRRCHDDALFVAGDAACGRQCRRVVGPAAGESEERWNDRGVAVFPCQASGCGESFYSVAQYEVHYSSAHRHPCTACHASFPTNHLLEIHLTESHDPLFDINSQSQDLYRCLLETCPDRLPTHQTRRDHMIKCHKYPANFRFEKAAKHKKPPPSTRGPDSMDTDSPTPAPGSLNPGPSTPGPLSLSALARVRIQTAAHTDRRRTPDMDTDQPAARKFVYKSRVPPTICFGAGSQRSFSGSRGRGRGSRGSRGSRGAHWHQAARAGVDTTVSIEDVDMAEMAGALDS